MGVTVASLVSITMRGDFMSKKCRLAAVGVAMTQVAAALIPHPIKGQEQCDTCHGPNGMKPFPSDHAGRPNESCTVCHLQGPTPTPGAAGASAGGAGTAPAIPHPIEGDQYKDCTTCHG